MKKVIFSSALLAFVGALSTRADTPPAFVESFGMGTPSELCQEVTDPQNRVFYEHEMQVNMFIGAEGFGESRLGRMDPKHGGGRIGSLSEGWFAGGKFHRVKSRQLVGVLMNSTPRAYLETDDDAGAAEEGRSTGEMNGDFQWAEAGKGIQTRNLTAFEVYALKLLQSGSELVTWRTTSRIRAMGAIRAGQSCLKCHEVKFGQLLGAFTYYISVQDPDLRGFAVLDPDKKRLEELMSIKSFAILPERTISNKMLLRFMKTGHLDQTQLTPQEFSDRLKAQNQMNTLATAGLVTEAMVAAMRDYRKQHEEWLAEYGDENIVRVKPDQRVPDK